MGYQLYKLKEVPEKQNNVGQRHVTNMLSNNSCEVHDGAFLLLVTRPPNTCYGMKLKLFCKLQSLIKFVTKGKHSLKVHVCEVAAANRQLRCIISTADLSYFGTSTVRINIRIVNQRRRGTILVYFKIYTSESERKLWKILIRTRNSDQNLVGPLPLA
jgi:hypothetical protein